MNQAVKVEDIANQLVSYYVPGGVFVHEDEMYRSWGDENGVSVSYENAANYIAQLNRLFELHQDIRTSYTYTSFERNVAAWLRPHITDQTPVDSNGAKDFFKVLREVPISDHEVFRPAFGISMSARVEPLVRGPYTIYCTESHLEPVLARLNEKQRAAFEKLTFPFLICVTVRAREFSKALEIADAHFERFENMVSFMVGRPDSIFEPKVLNYQGRVRKRAVVVSSDGVWSSNDREGPIQDLPIDDDYFLASEYGYDVLWNSLASSKLSDLMTRLLLAADWLGQSFAERVPASAFIKAAISIEILFTPQRGSVFTPAIGAQLSENVALLLGTDVPSRLKLEFTVKRLYSIRSEVAHAGKSELRRADVLEIQSLARAVIVTMLTLPAMRDVPDGEAMNLRFKEMKYSCSPSTTWTSGVNSTDEQLPPNSDKPSVPPAG